MTEPFRLLVCGGRDFANRRWMFDALDSRLAHHRSRTGLVIIHGGARGADRLAGDWAAERGVPCMVFPAAWAGIGKGAGPVRNGWMLEHGRPHGVLAFPGGSGTADMVRRAIDAGVPVISHGPRRGA